MRQLSISVAVLGVAAAGGLVAAAPAAAQPRAQAYEPPVTLIAHDVVYRVAADGTYTREETTRLRVNTAQAVRQQAQTYIRYSESLQHVDVLEAYTQTAAGERIDVGEAGIFTQQSPVSTNAPAFGDVKVTAIVFPQIQPGAVKTYRFRRTQEQPLFENEFSMLEQLSRLLEIESARVTLVAPADLDLDIEAIGVAGGRVEADAPGEAKWVWTLEDQAAERPEPDMVSPIDVSPRIAATTFDGFAHAAAAYLDGAADKTEVTDTVQSRADAITAGIDTPRAQARAIHAWVTRNVRYVALNFGLGGVVPRHVDEILASGYGDCKDKVVVLGALLAAKGIDAAPVLINSQNVYWQPDVAIVPGIYNHAIAYLPGLDLFLDPTAETAPFGVLPVMQYGKSALVTRGLDAGAGLGRLPPVSPGRAAAEVVTELTIAADGTAAGTQRMTASGALDYFLRTALAGVPEGRRAQVANRLLSSAGQTGEGSLDTGDPRDLADEFVIDTTFALEDVMRLPGPGALIVPAGVQSPAPIAGIARQVDQPARRFPMVCGAYDKRELTTMTLPDGVEVTRLPEPVGVENTLGRYTAAYTRDGRRLEVERRLVLDTNGGLCAPEDYPALRELGQAVGRDQRAQILYAGD